MRIHLTIYQCFVVKPIKAIAMSSRFGSDWVAGGWSQISNPHHAHIFLISLSNQAVFTLHTYHDHSSLSLIVNSLQLRAIKYQRNAFILQK